MNLRAIPFVAFHLNETGHCCACHIEQRSLAEPVKFDLYAVAWLTGFGHALQAAAGLTGHLEICRRHFAQFCEAMSAVGFDLLRAPPAANDAPAAPAPGAKGGG